MKNSLMTIKERIKGVLKLYPDVICPACNTPCLDMIEGEILCHTCDARYKLLDNQYPILIPPNAELFHNEIMIQDKVAINYEQIRYRNPWAQAYHEWWNHLMVSQVNVTGRILDNGCGTGTLFEVLPEADIVGLDMSQEMIRIAGEKNNRVMVCDSHHLPFSDESFDTVFARSLLHHLSDYHKGISEMSRVLRSGGEIVSVDTNKSILSSLPRKIFNKDEHFSEKHKNFHRLELVEAFSQYLTVEYVGFFGYIAYPVLAFPDIRDVFHFFPFKKLSYRILMKVDSLLARIPGIRSQAWALLIKARKQ